MKRHHFATLIAIVSSVILYSVAFADLVPKPSTQANFIGNKACADCHEAEYSSWQKTPHGKALKKMDDVDGGVLPVNLEDKASMVAQLKADGVVNADKMYIPALKDYVYVMPGKETYYFFYKKDGKIEILPARFNIIKGKWTSAADDNNATVPTGWGSYCLTCHTVNNRMVNGTYQAADVGVGCESCHGPGSLHAKNPSVKNNYILNPAKLHPNMAALICADCHTDGQRQDNRIAGVPASVYSSIPEHKHTGDDRVLTFAKNEKGEVQASFSRYPDWRNSKHAEVDVWCGDCHQFHVSTKEANADFGHRTKEHVNSCLKCHQINPAATGAKVATIHNVHVVEATCIDCHMYNGSHTFQVVTPAAAIKYNIEKDSCQKCHKDESHKDLQAKIDKLSK